MTSMVRILAAAVPAMALLAAVPAQAQRYGDIDGRWGLVNDPAGCSGDAAFEIRDGELTFAGGDPFHVVLTGFTLQVIPPEECEDCRTVPFDVMPDGTLQRFIDGTTEIYRPCPAEATTATAEVPETPVVAEPEAAEPEAAEPEAAEPAVVAETPVETPPEPPPATPSEAPAETPAAPVADAPTPTVPDAAPTPESPAVVAAIDPATEPALQPEVGRWAFRQVASAGEAYFDAGDTSLVVGCTPSPVPSVYVKYMPEPHYRFPIVESAQGRFNLMLTTVHPRWGAAQTPYLFDAALENGRAVYTYQWAGNQPFFAREQAYMAVAALQTGVTARIQSMTVGPDRRPTYQDEIPLWGSGAAIGNAMRAGGCAGFLATVGRAIEQGEIIQ